MGCSKCCVELDDGVEEDYSRMWKSGILKLDDVGKVVVDKVGPYMFL